MILQRRLVLAGISRQHQQQQRHKLLLGSRTSTTTGSSNLSTTVAKAEQPGLVISRSNVAVFGAGFCAGALAFSYDNQNKEKLHLPSGIPQACGCADVDHSPPLSKAQEELAQKLGKIVGSKNVVDGNVMNGTTLPFLKGWRLGAGKALCIVTPEKLDDILECVQLIIDADCVIIPQGRNTGLTGGSVPRNDHDHRPVVILSMKKFEDIIPVDNGDRVLCLAGAGLASLERYLKKNFPNRESHSALGSTFLNPTTAAGVAFGSGGSQCRKGPAFTERALYVKVTKDESGKSKAELVNTLGLTGVQKEETEKTDSILRGLDTYLQNLRSKLQVGVLGSDTTSPHGTAPAHNTNYRNEICVKDDKDSGISRFNADTRGEDCNRSEGKVLILATVHDTFPKPDKSKTFWVSFDSLETALQFRKKVCLSSPNDIPVSCEYMDRDSFDVIDRSGRVTGNTIKYTGTTSPIVQMLFKVKLTVEALPFSFAPLLVDKIFHTVNPIFPPVLSYKMMKAGREMDHHIYLTIGDFNDGCLDRFLERMDEFSKEHGEAKVRYNEATTATQCSGLAAFRYVAATAFRTWCVGEGAQGYSVDYALPKNGGIPPPLEGEKTPLKRMRYSHFACNVVHEDVAYGPGVDIETAKHDLKDAVERDCGGKLPAEHGHGTEYHAPTDAQERWKKMDPLNVMNPGVGGLSYKSRYQE